MSLQFFPDVIWEIGYFNKGLIFNPDIIEAVVPLDTTDSQIYIRGRSEPIVVSKTVKEISEILNITGNKP